MDPNINKNKIKIWKDISQNDSLICLNSVSKFLNKKNIIFIYKIEKNMIYNKLY